MSTENTIGKGMSKEAILELLRGTSQHKRFIKEQNRINHRRNAQLRIDAASGDIPTANKFLMKQEQKAQQEQEEQKVDRAQEEQQEQKVDSVEYEDSYSVITVNQNDIYC